MLDSRVIPVQKEIQGQRETLAFKEIPVFGERLDPQGSKETRAYKEILGNKVTLGYKATPEYRGILVLQVRKEIQEPAGLKVTPESREIQVLREIPVLLKFHLLHQQLY